MALNDNTREGSSGGNGPASGSPTAPPGTPGLTPGFRDAINALYQKYYGRNATDAELQAHAGNPGGIDAVETMLKASAPPAPPGPGPGPGPGPSPGPNGLPSPFTSPFTAPPPVNLGGPAGIPWIPQT